MSKSYDPKAPCWGRLCRVNPVHLEALARRLEESPPDWPPVVADEPNSAPAPLCAGPLMQAVCTFLGPGATWERACLSRLVPGVRYGYHRDGQPSNWITRVHVPLVTSPHCWFAWEEQEGRRVFMDVGWAYSFNTMKAHSYANDGPTDRVHLLFDVVRHEGDPSAG